MAFEVDITIVLICQVRTVSLREVRLALPGHYTHPGQVCLQVSGPVPQTSNLIWQCHGGPSKAGMGELQAARQT